MHGRASRRYARSARATPNLVFLHGVEEILLVGKHEQGDTREPLLLQQLLQLSAGLVNPPAVRAIDDVHKRIGLVEVVAPVGTDRLLTCSTCEPRRRSAARLVSLRGREARRAAPRASTRRTPSRPCMPRARPRHAAPAARGAGVGGAPPPISHTLSLKPSWSTDLMLNPCVGIVCVMSSSASFFSAVVLPALSSPSTRMRNSFSVFLSLRSSVSNPMVSHPARLSYTPCSGSSARSRLAQPQRLTILNGGVCRAKVV